MAYISLFVSLHEPRDPRGPKRHAASTRAGIQRGASAMRDRPPSASRRRGICQSFGGRTEFGPEVRGVFHVRRRCGVELFFYIFFEAVVG